MSEGEKVMNRRLKTLGLGFLMAVAAPAFAQSSANYTIQRAVLNNGGGEIASTNYRLLGSIGESVATGPITSVSYRLNSGFLGSVGASPAVLNLLSVVSRKFHGATPFNLTIDKDAPLNGNITIEPRAIGAGHTLVFHFDGTVNSVTAATALDALGTTAGTASVSAQGNDVIVTLANVADGKRLTLTLTGLNGTGTALASMGFLQGDVNGSRAVNAADIAAMKSNLNRTLTQQSFVFDLNADGTIGAADVTRTKSRSGSVVPQ
ncbi:MAG TPA: dockerin type I domain-containing protein [Vicinamibacterales bacterium]|nr:dockerin type I domain-containing protein [Vicinamibacterales bacterium]